MNFREQNVVIEYVHHYGSSLLAAALGSATVIWQTTKGNDGLRSVIAGLKSSMSHLEGKVDRLERKVDGLVGKVDACVKQSYLQMQAIAGNKKPLLDYVQWVGGCTGKNC